MAELLGFPPETRTQGGAPLTYVAGSSPRLPSAQDDTTILAPTADSVVISNVRERAPRVHRERRRSATSLMQAQINDLILSRECERCRSDLPSEEASGLMAASRVCRLELGEARDREYLEQRSGYENRFGNGLSQVKRELDQQQAARASGGTARPPKLRLSRLGERGGHKGALHATEARRELVELGRQESARKFLQWQELGERSRVQPRNGKFSPRELQKLSPRYGHPGHAFVPAVRLVGVVASAYAERACTPRALACPCAAQLAPARSGCAADAHTLRSAGPLLRYRVLGPPERRAIRRPAPGGLATAAAAPAIQPQGGDPVEPLLRCFVGPTVEAAAQKCRPWGAAAAPSVGRSGSGLRPPPLGCWLLESLCTSHLWPHRPPFTSRAPPETRWVPTPTPNPNPNQVGANLDGHDAPRNAR